MFVAPRTSPFPPVPQYRAGDWTTLDSTTAPSKRERSGSRRFDDDKKEDTDSEVPVVEVLVVGSLPEFRPSPLSLPRTGRGGYATVRHPNGTLRPPTAPEISARTEYLRDEGSLGATSLLTTCHAPTSPFPEGTSGTEVRERPPVPLSKVCYRPCDPRESDTVATTPVVPRRGTDETLSQRHGYFTRVIVG